VAQTPDKHTGSAPLSARSAKVPMVRTADGRLVRLDPGRSVQLTANKRAVDICFVFDTTGSMSNKIDGLVSCMVDFVGDLSRLSLDWRMTVVPFGDLTVPGDRVVADTRFVNTHGDAAVLLRTMPRFSGGGNLGESSLEAMLAAMGKHYRKGAVKILVVLTDESPLESPQLTTGLIHSLLLSQEFVCFVASPDLPSYRAWAETTGGKWYLIRGGVDTTSLLAFLRDLMRDVARVSNAVHELGGVPRYRQVEEKRRRELGGR
jgi:hypothetical protein